MSEKSLVHKNETWDKLSQVLEFSKFNFQNKNKNTKSSYFYCLWDFSKFLAIKFNIELNSSNKQTEINRILIKELIKLNSEDQLDPLSVKVHVVDYINNLIKNNQATSTIASKFAAIKDFFESITDVYKVDLSNIKVPKIEKKKIKGPKTEEFEKLIINIDQLFKNGSYRDKRNCLLFYIEIFCGLRISEVLSIDIEQVNLKESLVYVFRKGVAQHEKIQISVPPITLGKIGEFLKLDGRKKGPLFVNVDKTHETKRLSRQSAHTIYCEITEKYIGRKLSPHKFRHFYATEAYEIAGKNKDLAMKFTGHKTSRIFDDYNEEKENEHLKIAIDLEKKWIK